MVIRDTIFGFYFIFAVLREKIVRKSWICAAKMTTLDRGEEKIKYDDLQQHYDQDDISGYCR